MARYVRTAVNVPSLTGVFVEGGASLPSSAHLTFDYEVPVDLLPDFGPGHLVLVPFGGRTVQAVVLETVDEPAVADVRKILQLVDPEPVLTPQQIDLAQWMARRTLTSISAVIGLFLPAGLDQQADTLFTLNPGETPGLEGTLEKRIVQALRVRGALRGRQIDRVLPRIDWRRTARLLVRRGVIKSASILPPAAVRGKFVRTAELAAAPEQARKALDDLGATDATKNRRRKALEYLLQRPGPVNVSWIYAESACTAADLHALAERDLIVLREQEVWRDPLGRRPSEPPRRLEDEQAPVRFTAQQQRAWAAIESALGAASAPGNLPVLLQGVTGSGKTELYLRAATEVVAAGHQVIMLVPEIALTPQTVDRFVRRFPGQVGLVHSRLSDGERYDTWRRARLGALKVIIGPRSALFAPLPNVGLIVVDECHDSSYHQAEPPFYDAVAAAQAYARFCGALCLLGSATPTVAQRYAADTGSAVRLELKDRVASDAASSSNAASLGLPPVTVVDLRSELKAGNRGALSRDLKQAVSDVLGRDEQAILYLNRRGTATHVFCRACGHVVRCPRCDTPLTFHISDGENLQCHRCGYRRAMPKSCPECGSGEIRAYGLGTEKVEAELLAQFPKARTLRWDWESTRRKAAHELILHHFAAGRADVLIGTQMLAKGLDLPRVTLVGIVMADVGLFLPDPFAAERVFQLLTQVAGRAGRSTRGGKVVLQTFSPDHYVIRSASLHDVNGFHQYELAQRLRLGFPPYTRLLRLEFRHANALQAEDQARTLAKTLAERLEARPAPQPALIGPSPCFFPKLEGRYRWQIVVRGAEPGNLLAGLRLDGWRVEVDPTSLL